MKANARLLLLALALDFGMGRADWSPLNTPPTAIGNPSLPVTSLARVGNDLFAALRVGLMKSTDAGKTWRACPSPVPSVPVLALASHGSELYAAGLNGVFRSTDAGLTWTLVLKTPFLENFRMRESKGVLVAGSDEDNLWYSYDSGLTWTPHAFGPGEALAFVTAGNILLCGTDWGLFASGDHGASWDSVTGDAVSGKTSSLSVVGDRIFLSNEHSGLLLSKDGGKSWRDVTPKYPYDNSQRFDGYSFDRVQSLQGKLFLAGFETVNTLDEPSGIFVSEDSGLTWTPCNKGLPGWDALSPGVFDGSKVVAVDKTLLAATSSGIFASHDLGASWQLSSKGLPLKAMEGLVAYKMHLFGSVVYLSVSDPRFKDMSVYASTDAGKTWSRLASDIKEDIYDLDRVGDVGVALVASDRLLMTVDAGSRWNQIDGPWLSYTEVTAFELSGDDLYVSTGRYSTPKFWHSPDRGKTWIIDEKFQEIHRARAQVGSARFKTIPTGLAVSADSGITWSELKNFPPVYPVRDLIAMGNRLVALGDSLVYSDDAGKSWHLVKLPGTHALLGSGDNLSLLATEKGLYASTDGALWSPFESQGMGGLEFTAMAVSEDNILVARPDGIFRSRDMGANWARSGVAPANVLSLAAVPGHAFYAATQDTVYRSDDSGASWKRLPKLDPLAGYQPKILNLAAGPDRLYAGTSGGLFSVNDSLTWSLASNRTAFNRTNPLAYASGKLYHADAKGRLQQSSDGGKTWTATSSMDDRGFIFLSGQAADLVMASQTFLSARVHGADAWTPQGTGLPGAPITATAVDDDRLFAALFGQGLWWKALDTAASATSRPSDANDASFSAAAVGVTRVFRFHLGSPATISVSLLDARGRRLAQLKSAGKLSGDQTLAWEGKAPGLVFYLAEARSGKTVLLSRRGALGAAW